MMMQNLRYFAFAVSLGALCFAARQSFAQALPAGEPEALSQGFELPRVAGTLRYSLRLNQTFVPATSGRETYFTTNGSGDLGYISKSTRRPFSMVYSGGYIASTGGQPSSLFQNLALSQVVRWKRWTFIISDAASYLPESPVAGLAGIAGLGDLGNAPIQVGSDLGEAVQSQYAPRITNTASASVNRSLTGKTSVFVTAEYKKQHFTKGGTSGLDNDYESGSGAVSHRIDGRSDVSANFAYSRFNYPRFGATYRTQGATISYSRLFSRTLTGNFSGGPQYSQTFGVPASLSYQASAAISYTRLHNNLTASFVRSVNSGSGVATASRGNSFKLLASRKLGRYSSASAYVAYSKTDTLPTLVQTRFAGDTLVGAIQGSRSISRTLSTYGSYTIQRQLTAQNALGTNSLNGIRQMLAFGITYSPRAITVGRR